MPTPGTIVVKTDGTVGVLPSFKPAVFNDAGNACECCGCGLGAGDYCDDFSVDQGLWGFSGGPTSYYYPRIENGGLVFPLRQLLYTQQAGIINGRLPATQYTNAVRVTFDVTFDFSGIVWGLSSSWPVQTTVVDATWQATYATGTISLTYRQMRNPATGFQTRFARLRATDGFSPEYEVPVSQTKFHIVIEVGPKYKRIFVDGLLQFIVRRDNPTPVCSVGRFTGYARFTPDVGTLGESTNFMVIDDFCMEFFHDQDTALEYPLAYSNSANPPTSSFNWRIQEGTEGAVFPSVSDGQPPLTYTMTQGLGGLAPELEFDSSNGRIGTKTPLVITGNPKIGFAKVHVTDSRGSQANTPIVYKYEYITAIPITISYPTPYTDSGSGPTAGKDWRHDNASATSLTPTTSGGTAPFTYTIETGSLATGLSLASATGIITGSSSTTSTGSVSIRRTDSLGNYGISPVYAWEADLFP